MALGCRWPNTRRLDAIISESKVTLQTLTMRIEQPPSHQPRTSYRIRIVTEHRSSKPDMSANPLAVRNVINAKSRKVGAPLAAGDFRFGASSRTPRRTAALLVMTAVLTLLGLGGSKLHAKSPKKLAPNQARPSPIVYQPGASRSPMRGMTMGPIESTLHPDVGYGSDSCAQAMNTVRRLGGNWVSLTPFGRVWDLSPSGIDHSFEASFGENRVAIEGAIDQAHAHGLSVMLVPHLWVETGGWRGEIDFDSDAEWDSWAASYQEFVLAWAQVAERKNVALFSVGVELRSWVTTTRAPSFTDLIREVRRVYRGKLTYAANWDDAEHTVVWGELDLLGINAFFPLATEENATLPQLLDGGKRVADQVANLAARWQKPVLFTEIGYTNRPDPALKPWEWPEDLSDVKVAPQEQANAYRALLSSFVDEEWFAGFFVWRMYADPFDSSQEPAWGFSPLHRRAELVLRDAFSTAWGDLSGRQPHSWLNPRAMRIASY